MDDNRGYDIMFEYDGVIVNKEAILDSISNIVGFLEHAQEINKDRASEESHEQIQEDINNICICYKIIQSTKEVDLKWLKGLPPYGTN